MNFETLDYVIFGLYAILIISIGLWVSRTKKGETKSTEDYFLASKSLPWWAIGASLIAANISAEQFIGMSGSGFAMGLAIASYEWMAALTLLIVGKFFLPIFIKKGLYTIPEFVEQRFSTNLKTILAVFWIGLFVFVNLTTVLWLGAKALDTIMGAGDGAIITTSIVGLSLFAVAYSIWGGLAAVAWTDVVQVALLIMGGLVTTVLALDAVTPEGGVFNGFRHIYETVPEKFSMILSQGEIITPNGEDAWWDLPGLAVLIGGMWVANLYYWGFNQYIIQRTLAAKSLKESQRGIAFAAFLKMIIPLIVVVPGVIAFVMKADESGELIRSSLEDSWIASDGGIVNDNAAPWLIGKFVPTGLLGLVVAALAAAIVSSMASMLNSTSTIFTMDIYKPYVKPDASQRQLVTVGRITVLVALVVAALIAPALGNLDQVFQYIQEYTGVVSPGILAVFLTGLFWKQATNRGAIWGVISSIPIALFLKVGPKGWAEGSGLEGLFPNLPFMHQMMITCLLSIGIIGLVSWLENKGADDPHAIQADRSTFATDQVFNVSAFTVLILLVALYAIFW